MRAPGAGIRLLWLGAYALAMALVEAAVVVHLRHVYYADDPRALFPLRLLSHADLALELARELATVVMLVAVACLAERVALRRFAAFLFVFGLWDLGYYLWLKLALDWPRHWLEWDVLFLIPWPWFGPWLAPAAIALLFVAWGAAALWREAAPHGTPGAWLTFGAGAALGLFTFLHPGWDLVRQGEAAFSGYQPAAFHGWLFALGWTLMAGALLRLLRRA